MTPEEITAMAREAGFGRNGFSECLVRGSRGVWIDVQDEVNRLVALVAEKAAAKEREACASHIEDCESPVAVHGNRVQIGIVARVAYANSIRARGQKGDV